MKNSITVLLISLIAFVVIVPQMADAQKLPGIQTSSVRAPTDIKIDGKPTEWPHFEAYNNANEFYYTISNDNNNLYLVVQATYHGTIAKIVYGGITFTIKNNDKNSQIIPVAITYPYMLNSPGNVSYVLRTNKTLSEEQLSALNSEISGPIKEIPLTGAKGIQGESISIYNDLGIKANGIVDHQKAYTIELAVPLKYIEQVIDANGNFSYRLQVNGLDTSGKNGIIVVGGRGSEPSAVPVSDSNANFLVSPTYLDGSYTLAK
ncbi:MAG: hypothetical protein ABI367_13795 [Mucilaginibacter sp.]